jgi:hypothetical protein
LLPEGIRSSTFQAANAALMKLQPGDLVLSFDHTGEIHEAKIFKVHEHENERVIRYTLWGGQHLDATPNHWVLNQFNAFVEIDTLGSDDCLVDANGHLRPIVGKTEFCNGTVYNLTVEGHHTFIANGVRVHNAGLGLGIAGAGGGGGGGGGRVLVVARHNEPQQKLTIRCNPSNTPMCWISSVKARLMALKTAPRAFISIAPQSLMLNNTPNFTGYTIVTRNGTQVRRLFRTSLAPKARTSSTLKSLKIFL